MIIVAPLALSDKPHAKAYLRAMRQFGPYLEERLLLMPTPSAWLDPEMRVVIDGLQELFAPENIRLEVTQNDFGSTWPYAPGAHFRAAVDALTAMPKDIWFWMEPDCTPIKKDWVQLLKDDYKVGNTPFRGAVEPTRFIVTDAVTKKRTEEKNLSPHFVGAGLYPPAYDRYICPVNRSPMASYKSVSSIYPFDVKCRDQHLPCSQSPLFLHAPRTKNWKNIGDGVFTCEDVSKDEFGLTYAGEHDLSNIAVVHGCKDGSLIEAVLGGGDTAVFVVVSGSQAASKDATAQSTENVAGQEEWRLKEQSEKDALIQELKDELSAALAMIRTMTPKEERGPTVADLHIKRKPGRPRKIAKALAKA